MLNNNVKIPPQIVGYGLGIIILLWITYLLLRKIGLIASQVERKEEEAKEKMIESNTAYFSPTLWQEHRFSHQLLSEKLAKKLAGDIENAIGWLWDNETEIFNVFRRLSHKAQVSQLAYYYSSETGKDLLAMLYKNLSKAETNDIFTIINRL